jgi:thiamine biosynthesis protein ThiI
MPVLILHYHEIWLKGCNRNFFVSKLRQSARQALEGLNVSNVRHEEDRMMADAATDEDALQAVERLGRLPGVAYLAVAVECAPTIEAIVATGTALLAGRRYGSFRVRCKRAQRSLPFRSKEIEQQLGAAIREQAIAEGQSGRVDLTNAEVTCYVEATPLRALLYSEKLPGVGGLPTGTAGRLTCLLSGGYDSAVAAYKMIKRGARLSFVHFYGAAARPGEDSPPIARELVKVLTRYQGRSRLLLIPFADIQREVMLTAPESFRILIYRRLMLRIAQRIAFRGRAQGLVTGDSLAQVASQTLKNMRAVGSVAELPLYRPLIGDDKQEILDLARRIGTYDISSEPFTDCCPIYLPRNPEILSSVNDLDAAESRLDIPALVDRGVRGRIKEVYELRGGEVVQCPVESNEPEDQQVPVEVGG